MAGNSGAVAGLVVGLIILLLIIAAVVFLVLRITRKRGTSHDVTSCYSTLLAVILTPLKNILCMFLAYERSASRVGALAVPVGAAIGKKGTAIRNLK